MRTTSAALFELEEKYMEDFYKRNETRLKIVDHPRYYILPPLYKDIYSAPAFCIHPSNKLNEHILNVLEGGGNFQHIPLYLKSSEIGIYTAFPCKEECNVTIKLI